MILDMLYQSFYCANFSELSRLLGEGSEIRGFLSSFLPSPAPLEVVRYVVMTTEGWKEGGAPLCPPQSSFPLLKTRSRLPPPSPVTKRRDAPARFPFSFSSPLFFAPD